MTVRTFKDIQLYTRFAARKLGIPGYQIHQICLTQQELIYIPIPKNACSTIKQTLYKIEFGRPYNSDRAKSKAYRNIHYYYKKRPDAFTSVSKIDAARDCTRFTIVRDPLDRLISCYRNRVVDLKDLEMNPDGLKNMNLPAEPDLNTFVLHLGNYRKANKSIEHHSRPQAEFLGHTLHHVDYVYPIEEMGNLEKMLRAHSPDFKMPKLKSGGTQVELSHFSEKALAVVNRFYKKDYQLLKQYYSPTKTVS